jgi:hypothetical protein
MGLDSEAAQYIEKARKIDPEGLEVLTFQTALEKRPFENRKIYRKMLDSANRVALHNLARSQEQP